MYAMHGAGASGSGQKIVKVLLPINCASAFDYTSEKRLSIGSIVKVQFRGKDAFGLVVGFAAESEYENLLSVIDVDGAITFSPGFVKFLHGVSEYNMIPLGNVLRMVASVPRFRKYMDPRYDTEVLNQIKNHKVTLTEDQQKAVNIITNGDEFDVFLIDGVTGSGKTEVYLDVINRIIADGHQALVLLPEIVLTTQMLSRFNAIFGDNVMQWHSQLTEKQRAIAWRGIASGKIKFILGARSALFLPYKDLKVIVVDEEHDQSFKQEEQGVYNARDMAILRGYHEKCKVLLSSATPSIETLYNVKIGKYKSIKLPSRYGRAGMPDIEIIDIRDLKDGWISPVLQDEMSSAMERGEQTMLFINRRGYAPVLFCTNCKAKMECADCSTAMVYHKSRDKLICHHCSREEDLPELCTYCSHDSVSLKMLGPGVERVEENVKALFPSSRVEVITSDTINTPAKARKIIANIENSEVDIIIGTQMIAKGLHFKNLTVVGLIDVDLSNTAGDIRVLEKTFQLVHQIVGRAGREEKKGKVLIQTQTPDSPLLQCIKEDDRDKFVELELESRLAASMPPYGRIALVNISCTDENRLRTYCNSLASKLPYGESFTIFGPMLSPLPKIRNRYRYRFLIQYDLKYRIQAVIERWLSRAPAPRHINVSVDIDPINFL